MDLLLIEVRGINKYINNGLAYLGGSLIGRCAFNIIDLNFLAWSPDQLKDFIIAVNPKVLGFSVKSTNAAAVEDLIAELKGKINSLIIVGGPHVSLLGTEYLRANPDIDYGLQFEAERSLPLFFDFLAGQKKIDEVPGLVYRANGECLANPYSFTVDLDKLNFPDYDHFAEFNPSRYFRDHPYPLLTSRGCPYNCIYCSVKFVSGRLWRFRSVENIIEEIIAAKEKYQISSFELVDDNFTLDIDRALLFCRSLVDRQLNLIWGCPNGIRADRVNQELCKAMYESGCRHVALGIESGVPEIFDRIKKGEKLEDVAKAAKMLMESGIKVTGFFIVGLPGDSIKHTKQTVKFFNQLKLNGGIKWNFLIPYPHTELWDWIKKEGKLLNNFALGRHFSKTGDRIIPIFETADFSSQARLKAWKIANLSTESYSAVFKIPKNPIVFRLKMAYFLLLYAPQVLWRKLSGIIPKLLRNQRNIKAASKKHDL
ncbi:MAG: radical SAM protein [Candidatus Buchananbacteria bacterium]